MVSHASPCELGEYGEALTVIQFLISGERGYVPRSSDQADAGSEARLPFVVSETRLPLADVRSRSKRSAQM